MEEFRHKQNNRNLLDMKRFSTKQREAMNLLRLDFPDSDKIIDSLYIKLVNSYDIENAQSIIYPALADTLDLYYRELFSDRPEKTIGIVRIAVFIDKFVTLVILNSFKNQKMDNIEHGTDDYRNIKKEFYLEAVKNSTIRGSLTRGPNYEQAILSGSLDFLP